LGIVDRPLKTWRRRKLYGERHRQQLVAIKRLQARGLALDTIGASILSMSPHELAGVAGAARPAWVARGAADSAVPTDGSPSRRGGKRAPGASPPALAATVRPTDRVTGVELGPIRLTFKAQRSASEQDVAALAAHAAALLEVLESRGLLARSEVTPIP